MAKRTTEHTPNEPPPEAAPEPPKKPKKRSPARVAAAAFDRHAKLTEQIRRAETKIVEWRSQLDCIPHEIDDDARVVFERMVGGG